ncbi:hypothetical protein [Deinococcus rubellus]|uniref:hypothetical protein n=1 Tax=Deinococcus rubellus TaxID=1889240 RepID=UPI0031EF967D
MNPVAPSTQALALEERAAPLKALSDQILDLELQLEHLREARTDAELATRQLAALKTFLDDLLTEPPLPWAEPATPEAPPIQSIQVDDVPKVAVQAAAPEAPAEGPVPEAQLPALELGPEPVAAESAPLEDTPEQPASSLATPAAVPPEPETALPPQAPAEPEHQGAPDEDPEWEGRVTTLRREVVAWLSTHPGPHTAREISTGLEANDVHSSITKVLTGLFREGQIQRTGEGGHNDPYEYFVRSPIAEPEQERTTPEPVQTQGVNSESPTVEVSQESILFWFQTHHGEQSAQDVATAFDISSNSAGITLRLRKLWELGELRRFGQGITGDPFRYCLPSAVIAAPPLAPVMAEAPKLSVPSVRPPVVPDPVLKTADLTKVLAELTRVGTLTAKTCAAGVQLDQLVAERCLEALCDRGDAQRISLIRAESGARSLGYRVPRTNRESTETLAVPPQLTQDESALFNELRKDAKGKIVRTLLVKMQWGMPRLKKALDGLLHAGHIGVWGEATSATYAALAPQAWQ